MDPSVIPLSMLGLASEVYCSSILLYIKQKEVPRKSCSGGVCRAVNKADGLGSRNVIPYNYPNKYDICVSEGVEGQGAFT